MQSGKNYDLILSRNFLICVMILFNLQKLKQRLISNTLSDKEYFFYLIANWLLFGMICFAIVIDQYGNPGVVVLLLIIPIPGLFIAYRENQKGDGINYLQRIIPLHFVTGLRLCSLSAAWLILVHLVDHYLLDNSLGEDVHTGFLGGMLGVFYYSLISSIKNISSSKE